MRNLIAIGFLCLGVSAAHAWDPNKPFIYEMKIAFEADNWFNVYSTATVLSKSDNSVAFRVVANSTTTPIYQLVVTTQGSVGISTGAPQARLEVQGSPALAYSLAVGTSSSYQFVVSTGGNVGIGTPAPAATLAVNGNITANQITANNSMQEWSGTVSIPSSVNNSVNYVDLFSNPGGYCWITGTLNWVVAQSQVHFGQISFALSRYGLQTNTLLTTSSGNWSVALYANPNNPQENYLRFYNTIGTSWGDGSYSFNLQAWTIPDCGSAVSSNYLARTR